jgi:hypothetical protein
VRFGAFDQGTEVLAWDNCCVVQRLQHDAPGHRIGTLQKILQESSIFMINAVEPLGGRRQAAVEERSC